jgi:RNA polymerase sigma factor (TIGR02999 family)
MRNRSGNNNEVREGALEVAELVPFLYDVLRRLARQKMGEERRGHVLQTTALVHEAYLRLIGSGNTQFQSRQQFFQAAAEAMRRILIENARNRGAAKRGGRRERIPLDLVDVSETVDRDDILALDELIGRLDEQSPEAAAVVRLRFYAGLSVDETAAALGVSPRSVDRLWKFARAWLFRAWKAEP